MRDIEKLVLPVAGTDRELSVTSAQVDLSQDSVLKANLSDKGEVVPDRREAYFVGLSAVDLRVDPVVNRGARWEGHVTTDADFDWVWWFRDSQQGDCGEGM